MIGGQFATGELAAHAGLYLPFFKQLKVYVEALGRGAPVLAKKNTLLPAPDGVTDPDPIHPQSALGIGLSFHPHARVDLGVSVHRGFGGLAPWTISLNLLTLSIGKTYQERKATPVLQGAAEVAREFGTWAAEQWPEAPQRRQSPPLWATARPVLHYGITWSAMQWSTLKSQRSIGC